MIKRFGIWILPPLLVIPAAALTLFLPREDEPLLAGAASWRKSGNFRVADGKKNLLTDQADPTYWVAGRFGGDGSGRLVSDRFPAPRRVSLTVSGDLTRPGNHVYFRPADDDRRVHVRVHTDILCWRRVTLALPAEWKGKPTVLVAEAGPREPDNWFGLSTPRAVSAGTLLASQLRALRVLPAFAGALALFLLPGLLPALRLARGERLPAVLVVPAAVVFGCLAGYLTFWVYFWSPDLGRGFSWLVLLGSAAVLAADLRLDRSARSLLFSAEVRTPLALTALVGLFFLCLLYSVDLRSQPDRPPQIRFFEFTLALDNQIPYLFAERLYDHVDPRELIGEWHSSDRPPLQTGIVLLQLPLGNLTGEPELYSLLVACAAQCAWVPAVWALWRLGGLPQRRAGRALLLVVLTGFAMVNTVYTWPKLLAAALVLFGVGLAVFGREPGRPFPLLRAGLLGLASGLGMLAHGGVAFTLLPLALMLVLPRYYPGLTRLAAGAAAFALTMAPWALYQKYYDPPGTKLLRYHLAGKSETWQDDRPLWRNLIDAYGQLSAGQILENKLANLRVLLVMAPRPPDDQYPWPRGKNLPPYPADPTSYRRCEFLTLFWSLGLLNLGWLAALVSTRCQSLRLDRELGVTVPALGLVSVLVWVLLMFGPGTTVIHHGSYATFLLLFAPLAAWLAALPPRLAYPLLAVQGVALTAGWFLTSPANDYGPPNVFLIPLAAFFFAALAKVALGPAPPAGVAGAGPDRSETVGTLRGADVPGGAEGPGHALKGRSP